MSIFFPVPCTANPFFFRKYVERENWICSLCFGCEVTYLRSFGHRRTQRTILQGQYSYDVTVRSRYTFLRCQEHSGHLWRRAGGHVRVAHKAIKRLQEAYAQPPPLSTHSHVSASLGQHLTKSQVNSARGAARGWWRAVAGCAEAPFRQVLPEGGGGGAGTMGGGGVAGCGRAGGGVRWASRLVYTSQYQS